MRFRRLAIVAFALVGFALLAMAFWASQSDYRVQLWLIEANRQALVCHDQMISRIPGLEFNKLAQKLVGQRTISVGVYNEDDARKLFAMPPCPVRMVAMTVSSTPAEVVAMLRERLGPDNVQ